MSTRTPRVFITGAAGEIGAPLGNLLVAAGWDVSGCDLRPCTAARFPISICDLATAQPGDVDWSDCEAVVHLANHSDDQRAPPDRILAENAAMNRFVFAQAIAGRVHTLLFSSTMQVFRGPLGSELGDVEYLPLDGRLTYRYSEANSYAGSKRRAEDELRALAREHPERAFVVLRLPRIYQLPQQVPRPPVGPRTQPERVEGYSYLLLEELARLVLAIVRAGLTGFRCYFPAARDNLLSLPPASVIRRQYPCVPLRAPLAAIDALVDTSEITRDTGWRPCPVRAEVGSSDWSRRIRRHLEGGVGRRLQHLDERVSSLGRHVRRRLWLQQHALGSAVLVLPAKARLGEGPMWHTRERRLYWVDIDGHTLHRFDPVSRADEMMRFDETVSAVFEGPEARVLVALQVSLVWVDFDARSISPHVAGRIDGPPNRLNDGKRDAAGRVWIGSMHVHGRRRSGSLFAVHTDGRVERKLDGIGCSNGLTWSRDGRKLYFIDSHDHRIDSFAFDPTSGDLGRRRTVLTIPHWLGVPDGMCSDAHGKLWVALSGGGMVVCIDPDAMVLLGAVQVPARRVTSCAFGGPDLGTLYITTARGGLGPAELTAQPEAGGLFAFRPGWPAR